MDLRLYLSTGRQSRDIWYWQWQIGSNVYFGCQPTSAAVDIDIDEVKRIVVIIRIPSPSLYFYYFFKCTEVNILECNCYCYVCSYARIWWLYNVNKMYQWRWNGNHISHFESFNRCNYLTPLIFLLTSTTFRLEFWLRCFIYNTNNFTVACHIQ